MKRIILFLFGAVFALDLNAQCLGIQSTQHGWTGTVDPTTCPSLADCKPGEMYTKSTGEHFKKEGPVGTNTWALVESDPTFAGWQASSPNIDTDQTNDWVLGGNNSGGQPLGSTDSSLPIMAAGTIIADFGSAEANIKIGRTLGSVDVSSAHNTVFLGDNGNVTNSNNQLVNGTGLMDIRDGNTSCYWQGSDIDHVDNNNYCVVSTNATSGISGNQYLLMAGEKNNNTTTNYHSLVVGASNESNVGNSDFHILGNANNAINGTSGLTVFGDANTGGVYNGVNHRVIISNADKRFFEFDKANGELMIDGSAGNPGDLLMSNGASTPPKWQTFTPSASLSGITAATATNTITNGNFAQTWEWTNTSQTPLTLISSTETSGGILSVIGTTTANSGTQGLLNVANNTSKQTGTVLSAIANNIAAGNGLFVLANGNTGTGTNAPTATFDNAGTETNRALSLSDIATNGPIGSAAATVDIASTIFIAQTTAGVIATLPNPTASQSGRKLRIVNTGSVPLQLFSSAGPVLENNPLKGGTIEAVWNGSAWVYEWLANVSKQYTATTTQTIAPLGTAYIDVTPPSTITITIDPTKMVAGDFLYIKDPTGTVTPSTIVQISFASGAPDFFGGSGFLLSNPYASAILRWNGSKFEIFNLSNTVNTRTTSGSGNVSGFNVLNTTLTTGTVMYAECSSSSIPSLTSSAKTLNVSMTGGNTNASVTSTALNATNNKTGTSSINIAASFSASGGTDNYGLQVPSGKVVVGGVTSTGIFDVQSTTQPAYPAPRMTEAQMLALTGMSTGATVHNTTWNEPEYYDGKGWKGQNRYRTITATTALTQSDNIVYVNNGATAITITIPASNDGAKYTIARYDNTSTGTITVQLSGGTIMATGGTIGATSSISVTAGQRSETFQVTGTVASRILNP